MKKSKSTSMSFAELLMNFTDFFFQFDVRFLL